MNLSKLQEIVDRGAWRAICTWDCKELDTIKQLNNNNSKSSLQPDEVLTNK